MRNNITLKAEYVKYYKDVPIQKYAAMFIAKDEDTIIRWRKEDSIFADAVLRAKAEWVRKRLITTRAEFALERLEKNIFSNNATIEVDVSGYDRYIASHQLDPNTVDNRRLIDRMTSFLMEETKAK